MSDTPTPPPFDLHVDVSTMRASERITLGMWWHCEWTDDSGATGESWAQARVVYDLRRHQDDARVVRVLGVDTTGVGCELLIYRGKPIRTLSARDAARLGIALPQDVVPR